MSQFFGVMIATACQGFRLVIISLSLSLSRLDSLCTSTAPEGASPTHSSPGLTLLLSSSSFFFWGPGGLKVLRTGHAATHPSQTLAHDTLGPTAP